MRNSQWVHSFIDLNHKNSNTKQQRVNTEKDADHQEALRSQQKNVQHGLFSNLMPGFPWGLRIRLPVQETWALKLQLQSPRAATPEAGGT